MEKNGSFRDALGETLHAMGDEFTSLVVVTPDLAKSVRITAFKESYPERFITTGISEADCISVAAGLAAVGLLPVVAAFAMFAAVKPYEQIRNSIAYPGLNVKIIATHGGICAGRDGATHQAIEDIALMRALPGFAVLVAADAMQTRSAIRAMMAHAGPVYLRLGRDQAKAVYHNELAFTIGKADVLRNGNDVSIIACGTLVAEALKAAEGLAKEGIAAQVINMHSIKPLDEQAIVQAATQTGAIVTAEDHSRIGGLGGAVAETLARHHPAPMEMVAVDDRFAESGSQEELYRKYGLDAEHIIIAVKRVLARKCRRATDGRGGTI